MNMQEYETFAKRDNNLTEQNGIIHSSSEVHKLS